MENKLLIKNYAWEDLEIVMQVTSYQNNGQIAILLYEKETGEYYTDLSVFVEPFENKLKMAVDTNNFPYGEEFIQKYNLWTLVDYVHSWFCSYPVYEMDIDELKERDELWVKEFIKENNIEVKEKTIWDRIRN